MTINLSWRKHIVTVARKIRKTIGTLSKLRHFITFCVLVNIYNELITPHLTYGLISWGNACKRYLDKILIPASKTCTMLNIFCKQTRSCYFLIRKCLSIAIKFVVL